METAAPVRVPHDRPARWDANQREYRQPAVHFLGVRNESYIYPAYFALLAGIILA